MDPCSPAPEVVWKALDAAYRSASEGVERGEIFAAWDRAEEESAIEDEVLRLQAPCRFCDLTTLCGAAFGEEVKT